MPRVPAVVIECNPVIFSTVQRQQQITGPHSKATKLYLQRRAPPRLGVLQLQSVRHALPGGQSAGTVPLQATLLSLRRWTHMHGSRPTLPGGATSRALVRREAVLSVPEAVHRNCLHPGRDDTKPVESRGWHSVQTEDIRAVGDSAAQNATAPGCAVQL
uniref:(northern house mosquito) hypothetical protein n=1 Tax=Culex pipiens TaxID=7175 RepID=A0A8D8HS08_CULPI